MTDISQERIERDLAERIATLMLGRAPSWKSTIDDIAHEIAPELAAAEARGRIAGLREASEIAGTHYDDKNRVDFTRDPYINCLQISAKIDSRIAALANASDTPDQPGETG